MKTIWKYPLDISSSPITSTHLTVPENSRPVLAALDLDEMPCIWFEVDSSEDPTPCTINTYWTGYEVTGTYVGTFTWLGLIYHAYLQ